MVQITSIAVLAGVFMNRILMMVAVGLLAGCQSGTDDRDISGAISDPKLRAQLSEDYQQRQVAMAAMRTHCASQWRGDPSMIAYCEEAQTPVVRRYVSNQVRYKHLNKGGLFAKEYRAHTVCRAAHPGDFEMAQACVENDTAVRRLTALQR